MREIKFRAWDRTTNKNGVMVPWEDLQKFEVGVVFMRLSEVIMMQCTGLKDKNGVEIYEGDIAELTFEDNGKETGIIHWCKKQLRFKFSIYGFSSTEEKEQKRFKIIGNIHENPELLNN